MPRSIPNPPSSRINYLDYRTITLRIGPLTHQAPAFCVGDLAIFRFDKLLPKYGLHSTGEDDIWAVAIISLGRLFPSDPLFLTVESAAGFILDAHKLYDWSTWDTDTDLTKELKQELTDLGGKITEAITRNQGCPLAIAMLEGQKDKP